MNSNLLFIKLCKNTKEPIKKVLISNKKNALPLEKVNINLYNVGLHAGHNNLIVLDIDKKNDGIEEFQKYIDMYDEPQTVKQKSPNGGYHLIFNAVSTEYTTEENYLISLLKNKAGYRKGKGIDIRINNGYVVCEPSTIDDKEYKFIRHYKDNKILNIPVYLLNWLLEFDKPYERNELYLIMTRKELKKIVEMLSKPEYYNNEWFKITSCFKNLINEYTNFTEDEIKEIWDKWSKQGEKYNKKKNFKIFDEAKTLNIDFNYYIKLFNVELKKENKKELPSYETIKPYTPLIEMNNNIKVIKMNNEYIYDKNYKLEQVKPEYFKEYDTLIIESGTGTGKTSNTAKHIKKLMNEEANEYKVLSIISRKTLAEQHIDSFNKEGIILKNYQDIGLNYDDDNTVICINSILKYQFYKPEFFKNYIVYIDEVNTFTRHLTHNDTLNNVLKKVYVVLNRIINNCHKLICTEAIISDNVFNLLSLKC